MPDFAVGSIYFKKKTTVNTFAQFSRKFYPASYWITDGFRSFKNDAKLYFFHQNNFASKLENT